MPTTSSIAMPSSERVPYFDTIIRVVLAVFIAVLPFKPLLIVERNGFILLLGLLVGVVYCQSAVCSIPRHRTISFCWPLWFGSD